MWLLGLPRHGMLFRGLLYFMVHVNRQCLQFADKSCTFLPLRCPFPPSLRLSPTSLLPPKLPIKTNLASREIKPTLSEEWHQLQVSYCAFCTSHSATPLVSFSLPPILSATHSNSPLCYGHLSLPDPHLPLTADECAAAKKGLPQYGYCVQWAFIWMSAWSPLTNSIARLLVSSQKDHPLFRFPSLSQRAICQLGYEWTQPSHSGAPSVSRNTRLPSGIIWESINL